MTLDTVADGVETDGDDADALVPGVVRLTLVGGAVQAPREVARPMRPGEADAPTPREALAHDRQRDRVAGDVAAFVTMKPCHAPCGEGRRERGGRARGPRPCRATAWERVTPLAASASATSSASGALTTATRLAASAGSTSSATGVLTTTIDLAASAYGTGAASAALTLERCDSTIGTRGDAAAARW